ncbi:NAD(P)-dependent oxidoreductase [Vibrio coralliilyticus]|uniref:NAD(P)-dependent oxidoreductase n=1 Tax=Vibrio coralliilyticus TaxID=190893 RepID=UPI00030629D1|nr:NAD(P)-binding oxidoreductase [Vibrio coralliilyticus]
MAVLVLGATGATGRLVVRELLLRGDRVKVVVRALERVDRDLIACESLDIVVSNVLDLSEAQLMGHLRECEAVICCLGHNLTLNGIYGQPRKLVSGTIKRICQAVAQLKPLQPIKLVLMSTTGFQNRRRGEVVSWRHRMAIQLVRQLLPPHVDNEEAARYLQYQVGDASPYLEWVAVRPDSLVDHPFKTEFSVHPSPTCDSLFAPRKSSRINVAHFMIELVGSPQTWSRWKQDMPVLYNNP